MTTNNSLLCAMTPEDRNLLISRSEMAHIPARALLEEPNLPPAYIYFFESGLASLMYKGRGDYNAEVAVVGREGCTGCAVILGAEQSPQAITMQVSGSARRIRRGDFETALEQSAGLHRLLLRFVNTQIVQRDETSLAASKATLIERLARWLLMVSDRLGTPKLPLTHDLIALMLSTRRAGITVGLGALRDAGFITTQRAHIDITDRNGLLRLAGPYYGAGEAEFERLFSGTPALAKRAQQVRSG